MKTIEPDLVINLTAEQIELARPLRQKQVEIKSGMIFGSLGTDSDGKTIALSYLPHHISVKIINLVNAEMGEQNDENS